MKRMAIGIGLMGMLAAGCGGSSFDCNSPSKCQGDGLGTPLVVSICQKEISDPQCGSVFDTALSCSYAHEVCDSSGEYDGDATTASCQSQDDAFQQCCAAHPDAGLCG
jgi:hypothetical protein